MSKSFTLFWLSLFLILNSFGVNSQEKSKTIALKQILTSISKQHKVQFNFIEEEVENVKIIPPNRKLSLTEKLIYLNQKTNLDFEKINEKYIAVSSKVKDKTRQIITDSASVNINEISIERYLARGISKSLNGTFVVKPKDFGILPGLIEPDVLQTMQQIPGIYSADESVSNINVRSGTHDQNLFLWNGIRMYQTGHFFGMISVFNPFLANKISIHKNGTSAFYGESVSSVVDISSNANSVENTVSSISSNLINVEFNTRIKTSENSSLQISGRRSLTDLASTPTYQNYFDRVFQNTMVTDLNSDENVNYNSDEKFYFYDFTAQYQQKLDAKTELIADFIGISNSLAVNQNTDFGGNFSSKKSKLEQQNFGGSLSINRKWNDNNSTKISSYISYYNLDATNNSVENNQVLDQTNNVLDFGLRLQNRHFINDNLTFNSGYQYNEIGITNYEKVNNPEFQKDAKEVLRTHSLVLEAELSSPDKTAFLKTGLRSNYIEKFKEVVIEPRIQFNYLFSNQFSAEILSEQKSQTTSQVIDLQQDFLGVEKRRWVLSDNDEIPIQKSSQISLGFTFKNKNWLLTLDNYYKNVTGISTRSQSFQNQLEFTKLNGDYSVLGSEILVQRNFEKFHTWISYSLSNSNYTFDSYFPEEFSNNFQIVHSVSWAGIYEWKNIKIALGSKWNSGRPETTPLLSNMLDFSNPVKPKINYNLPNNNSLSDYFQVNFSAGYLWKFSEKSNLDIGISVLNILNKKNIINRYYRINQQEFVQSVNTFSLKRTPNISLKYNF
ncbi:TonB-dependent receptor plug domain-containing protein [Flavobacterium qiangtangense]|uniref:TonB-dependent receptor plug domain-containing protein n=1 Tax=Flavobacterium qiangtangense TaxID=1442595 RepID=A0ABW1PNV3_9FLAO